MASGHTLNRAGFVRGGSVWSRGPRRWLWPCLSVTTSLSSSSVSWFLRWASNDLATFDWRMFSYVPHARQSPSVTDSIVQYPWLLQAGW